MANSDHPDNVPTCLRLGWALAELQGRYRPDPPKLKTEGLPVNAGIALALRPEHTQAELREQVLDVFRKVFGDLAQNYPDLDNDDENSNTENNADENNSDDSVSKISNFSEEITERVHAVKPSEDMEPAQWIEFTALVRRFDGHVQNTLAASSDSELSGYLLGRGLAETFWALQPTNAQANGADTPAPKDQNWTFLLGADRVAELQRLLGRLSSYFSPYTAPSISGSLCVWQEVAKTEDWRDKEGAQQNLYDQTRRWYELLVIGQDPTTLIKPFAFLRNLRGAVNAARAFLPQLVLGVVSIAALFGVVAFDGSSAGKAFGAAIGVAGLSLTSLTAKAKSSAQAMTSRLRQDSYSDLVAIEITIVPPRQARDLEDDRRWRRLRHFRRRFESPTRRAVSSAIRTRPLTTAVVVSGSSS